MYTPNQRENIRNKSIYSQLQDINIFLLSEFITRLYSLLVICIQRSDSLLRQNTSQSGQSTTVHVPQHYRNNSSHTSELQLQRYTCLNIRATLVNISQHYSYNSTHISALQLQ